MIWTHANIELFIGINTERIIEGGRTKSRGKVQQSKSIFMHDQHGPAGATEGFCATHRLFPEDD